MMPVSSPWRGARLSLSLVGLVLATAGACGNPDFEFVPDDDQVDDGGGPPPPVTRTVCATDDDCAGLSATGVCDTASGYCVECLPAREGELNRCAEGLFCQAGQRCGVGCASDLDCRGLTCDGATNVCTGCVGNADCTPGTVCQGAVCVPGCAADTACPSGWSCCSGQCQNPLTDPASCGGCGSACEATGDCINGVCGPGPCPPGFGECDADPANGCETNLVSDPTNCGRCRVACASGLCSGGACTSTDCRDGFADCNQIESDGCEANLSAVENCGMCGLACNSRNGEPSCTRSGCSIACDAGFGDCDDDADSGCEVDLASNDEHCGRCGVVCGNDNGSTRCTDGECRPTCALGFDDCDADPTNGCETDIATTLTDCGACGRSCNPANAAGTCVGGLCEAGCSAGFEDCDGDPANGCEADLSSPETCSTCENRCNDNGGTPICNPDGSCGITCATGRADCISGLIDGCETNTNTNVLHCAGCGRICPGAVGQPACLDGVCGVSMCTSPNEECDGNAATVCETDLSDDPANCNACGVACFYPNGLGICVNRGCVLDDCVSGFADCSAAAGCETRLGTLDNCRQCGETCRNDHGGTSCEASGCIPTCQIGFGNCDGDRNDGCETPLNTLFNCGACGSACTVAHGTPSCSGGTCQVATCEAGWDDCDDNPANGCETPLNTLGNCGGCGVACNLPHAAESCGTGVCTLGTCDAGWLDCSAQAGCETQLGTLQNCTSCGDVCANPHGTTTCGAGGCTPVCDASWKSCDGDRGNGCETSLATLTNCGDCGVACNLPNATESCSTGSCAVITCASGFGNCDGLANTGCETPLGTLANCLGCGDSCSNAHGSTSCSTASGCLPVCSTGWDSCDGDRNDGCETSIWSLPNCGSCGVVCDIPNQNESCGGGTCAPTSCSAGFADCVAGTPGCETQLGTTLNCRACGEDCTNAHGTTSCNATNGCIPVCSAGWKSCNGIPDDGCETSITSLTSCGDCGVPCSFPNSGASCSTGSCTQGACSSGFADCSVVAGCETTLGTAANCAACSNACTNLHGGNTCTGAPGSFDCSPTCDAGFRSCNGNPDDGCETAVNTLAHCGNCNVACSFPNGAATCSTGTCAMTGCNSGFADCSAAVGCETALGSAANCAACGNACTNAHGPTSCAGSPGSYDCAPSCDAGWLSCDANPDNGCERNVRTLTDCGACGVACSFSNAAESCTTGTCSIGTCDAGFGNCDAVSSNGCETTLGNSTHCAACGNACTNSHGTNACTGSPGAYDCSPACDANWLSCNGNPDDGCETDATTTTNCGVCGRVCSGATPFCLSGPSGYNCAAQLPIVFVGDADHSAGSASSSFTHSLVTGAGQSRIVLLALASSGNTAAGAMPEIVTYNGTGMTFYGTPPPFGNNQAFTSFWYLLDASLGAAGNKTVVVDASAGSSNPTQFRANLLEFKGVHQTQPINVAVTANNGNCGSGQYPIHSITTTTNGSFIVDLAAAYTGGGVTYTPIVGSLTPTLTAASSSPLAALVGYRGPLAPAVYSVGWTVNACNNSAHQIIALRPVN